MNMNRLFAGVLCTVAIFTASGCPKRVPATPNTPDQPVVDQPVDQPPADTPPADQPPVPQPPVQQPPVQQPPVQQPPVQQPPVQQPPVQQPPADPKPADPKPDPKPDPQPDPKPKEPTAEKVFIETLSTAMGAWNYVPLINDVRSGFTMKADGWSKGTFDTPEEYIARMHELNRIYFPKPSELVLEKYIADAGTFAGRSEYGRDMLYFVDLKKSTENANRKELYILRFSTSTKEVIGIKKGDANDYTGFIPFNSQTTRAQNAETGKIFVYSMDTRENILADKKRFLLIPEMFLYDDWNKRYEAQQKAQADEERLTQQRYVNPVSYNSYNAGYPQTAYPQQTGYPQQNRY